MDAATQLEASLSTIGLVFTAMATLSIVEAVVPLQARDRCGRSRVGPNLALTTITIVLNVGLTFALTLALVSLDSIGYGLRHWLPVGSIGDVVVAVVVLDFATYVAHVAMHKSGLLWRFHRVHHADPFVDVTTTIRQHPGEGLIRYVFLATVAIGLGLSPAGFAVYRLWSVLNGLLEHANVRTPTGIDRILSLLIVTPNMHKVHHSRDQRETNSNYGNIFSWFDRLLSTFTPSERVAQIRYGLDGLDDRRVQTTAGLLALPFTRDVSRSEGRDPLDAQLTGSCQARQGVADRDRCEAPRSALPWSRDG